MIQTFNFAVMLLFLIFYTYQLFYIPIPYLIKPKKHEKINEHSYAVLIAARNESAVIAELLSSIKNQTYPSDRLKIFVVADNCTDNTAEIARNAGAVVYERNNQTLVGKGYALNHLLASIANDYGDGAFDGYFVFDADNVLSPDYISEMNKTFSDGNEIVTSYRNSKNYGDNWISAGYALWFLREAKYLNNSRMLLGTSCAVSGTGFMFSDRILKKCGGWNFFLLTEDIEFSIHNITDGEKISYCPSAELYDEQPTTFKQSWNQRMRWARGYIEVISKYGKKLFGGIFRGSFSCYDMAMNILPVAVLSGLSIVVNLTSTVIALVSGGDLGVIGISVLEFLKNIYLTMAIIGAITTVSEWQHIHTTVAKKILYVFTFPIFMLTYIPISMVAIFKKTEWKEIKHTRSMTLGEICSGTKK